MRFLQSSWFPVCLGIIVTIAILSSLLARGTQKTTINTIGYPYRENEVWTAPPENEIPVNEEGDLIRYGKELIVNTSKYLGPKGIVAHLSNGMNCQNCHIAAGTQNLGNPFSAVTSTYPKYRDRSGRVESIEFRINECMQRSLDGEKLDSLSEEMRAMVAFLKWMGKDVPQGVRPRGSGSEILPFLERAADPEKGKQVYIQKCQRCHGENGEGFLTPDSTIYTYPPLWGNNSFNVSAGLYRLSNLAGFIKNNMPFGVSFKNPELTNEQSWDVAAYISSQQRSQKRFSYDWPNISKKPIDYPFGPFADNFPEQQHRYGPFGPIKKMKSQ